MSRRSSRLHTLERSLKAPRKPRSPARAFTVMRLEGGAAGAQSNPRPARLPKDMEDQIAVVRGRAAGKPSRGLLQLEARLLGTHKHDPEPAAPAIQRHDHGAPPASAVAPAPAAQARAMASNAFGGRYNVESFEDSSAAMPVSLPRTEYYAGTAPATVALPKTEFQAGTPPTWIQAPSLIAAPAAGVTLPWAAEQSRRAERKRALTQDQKDVAASFERDIASMLGADVPATAAPEDKQWDDTVRNAAHAPSTAGTPAASIPAAPAAPQRDAHDVFNQMGLAMNYANSFDLGAMDLSARFDHFDNELALAPQSPLTGATPVPVQALSLDDFDLVADLAEISGAQSAPPTAAAPASEPSVSQQDTSAAALT